ncbi:hypothetical protein [Neobacillus drentensis]|nr:hypothetical protein [Neobacillus drentensis]
MEASKDSCGNEISEAANMVTETDKKIVFSLDRNNEGAPPSEGNR